MTARILAASAPGEIRIAVIDAAGLRDYALWRPGWPDGVGDLHRGRAGARLVAMGGTFIDLADGASGFLPDSAAPGPLAEGDPVLVRIVRAPQDGKGARLAATGLLLPEGQTLAGPPALLARGPTPLEALAAAWPAAPIVIDDIALGARLPAGLRGRVQRERRAFDAGTEAACAALADPSVTLPGGMRATITPTPALVAIDMDGGAASTDRRAKQTAQFAANRDALPALLHQIRLRNLSGAIVIDVAGLAIRKRPALRETIEAALAQDPLRPRFLGFSALGLAEIMRPRIRPPLHALLSDAPGHMLRMLDDWSRQVAGQPGRVPGLRVGTDLARALEHDPGAVADTAQRSGHQPGWRLDPSLSPLSWMLDHA
ncbi:ribonuclease E/G [Gluconacetobacter takamatsuzukensis]|uniref:Ribonuclease n=1 Tax=Gluconacetobacter takamatsuzukensis TaxID=1286190 RepID=A0A7W4KBK0_9PROT|nr:ribonuclease [Gluconacetobacter takamatsuzukensis]